MNQNLRKLSSFTLPWPTDWTVLFGVEYPLILEIGFGYGHYLEHLARRFHDHNVIGLEIDNYCLSKVERVITRKELHNIRVIHARAETALHHLFTPASIRQIHVNFPDPWFKDRHAGRRLMQRDTLDAMVSRLEPGGMFYLATDILPYATMSADLLADTPGLTNTCDSPWAESMPDRVITKYEKKAHAEGRTCYYFAYRRTDHPGPSIPVIEEREMPHIVLKTPLTLAEIYHSIHLEDITDSSGETHLSFLNTYHNAQAVLVEVYIREPTIDQRIAVVIAAREGHPDEYTVKLSMLGTPRPTDGVHLAVRTISKAVQALHTETAIIHDKVRG